MTQRFRYLTWVSLIVVCASCSAGAEPDVRCEWAFGIIEVVGGEERFRPLRRSSIVPEGAPLWCGLRADNARFVAVLRRDAAGEIQVLHLETGADAGEDFRVILDREALPAGQATYHVVVSRQPRADWERRFEAIRRGNREVRDLTEVELAKARDRWELVTDTLPKPVQIAGTLRSHRQQATVLRAQEVIWRTIQLRSRQ